MSINKQSIVLQVVRYIVYKDWRWFSYKIFVSVQPAAVIIWSTAIFNAYHSLYKYTADLI